MMPGMLAIRVSMIVMGSEGVKAGGFVWMGRGGNGSRVIP